MVVRGLALFLFVLGLVQGQPSTGVSVRGEYRNLAGYAYRVTVPAGFTGYRDAAPAPAHGFAIDLGPGAWNRISVQGLYNAAEYPSAQIVAERTVAWITDKADSIEEPQFRAVALGGLPAVELVVRYRDKETAAARVCRSVAAIRRIKPTDTMGIIYEIMLDASAESFVKGGVIYETLVSSFRLDPLMHY
jgi:hypothetical protein